MENKIYRPKKCNKNISSTLWLGKPSNPYSKLSLDHRQRWVLVTDRCTGSDKKLLSRPVMLAHTKGPTYIFITQEQLKERFELVETIPTNK